SSGGMPLAECQPSERILRLNQPKRKMMKRILSLTGVVLACVLTNLSTQTAAAADETATSEEKTAAPDYRPFTLGVEAASTGLGGSLSWRFADHFGARVGFDYFEYTDSGDEFMGAQVDIVDIGLNVIGQARFDKKYRLMSEPIGLDIYPWKKSTFRITVGIMVNQNEATGVIPAAPVAGQTFLRFTDTGFVYDSEEIGDVTMKVEQLPVAPYVSIGASYFFDKAKHWSVAGEVGVAYTGNPDVTVTTGTPNALDASDVNAITQEIEDGTWQFYPIVKVSVNYSF
ncbi:MAG TPA: hypothetical protein VFZ59_09885, partial [Verrucomicrobiae bacterium]|nr:hypothetical protein [Verrucomicrobiae bacterium]